LGGYHEARVCDFLAVRGRFSIPHPRSKISPALSKLRPLERHRAAGPDAPHNESKERAMQYMLLVYWNETERKSATKEQKAKTFAAYMAYTEALKKAGVFLAGSGLQDSSTASVVRAPDGKARVLNGHYIESKEQLGGYYLIEAADLDGAIAWAARCPGARQDAVEVRPLMIY
jgi:hypothetical protein